MGRVKLMSLFLAFSLAVSGAVFAQEAEQNGNKVDELKSSIESKAEELNKLSSEIAEVEANLGRTKAKSQNISQDVSRLSANIRQLDLRVRAGEITVDKLRLELRELSLGIRDIQDGISTKKAAVAASLRVMQQKDTENLLVILLRNGSLADSVAEAQNIFNLNQGLSVEISGLQSLQEELAEKVSTTSGKKQSIEQETQNAQYQQKLTAEQKAERERLLNLTKAEQREYEAQLAELEKQQEAITRVIEELEHELRASFDPSLLPLKRPGVLAYPVTDVYVTQEYGQTDFAAQAYKSKTHGGVDFRASIGTPILAAEDGIVMASDNNDKGTSRWQKYQYGQHVLIEHDNNLATLYAHLSTRLVSKGERVTRGQVIGYSGSTGYSTGPHLHFGVYWAPSIQLKSIPPAAGLVPIGVTIDPEDYL